MKIFDQTYKRESPCSKYVAWWNTWDHEHLFYVHKQFGSSKILSENSTSVVIKTEYKLPLFNIKLSGFHCMFNDRENNCRVIDYLPFGIEAVTDIEFSEINANRSLITNRYQIFGNFVFFPLRFILPSLIKKWNKVNWEEDLELKTRRSEALKYGFKDFAGLQESYSKENDLKKYKLPLPRLKPSILDFNSVEVKDKD